MKRKSIDADNILRDLSFYHYLVQYQGDIKGEIGQYPDYNVIIIDNQYAIVSVKRDVEINVGEPYFSTIVYVKLAEFYTLQQISPIEASGANFLQLDLPLSLTGKGVDVAIIDTGIDYLNEEFMTLNGETRIECIWDQTSISAKEVEGLEVPFGTIYMKEDIQRAINEYKGGRNPYEIVPTVDEIGHGTNCAGIIGATGKNSNLKGVVPNCDFVVVKLMEDYSFKDRFKAPIPVYNITAVFAALEFIYRYAIRRFKPMIIYFPLGCNLGSHEGDGFLDQYIGTISINRGIALVTGAGNQRAKGEHTSGRIFRVGEISEVEIDVSPEKKDLWVEVWVDKPNIMSLQIISPSGESSGVMNALLNFVGVYTFIFEKTSIKVNYFLPEVNTGDELIRIRFYDLQPGIWKLRLIGNLILDGIYDIWMLQSDLTPGTARFTPSDPYGTFTNPSNSRYIIKAAAYNQNNNNITSYSGVDFVDNFANVMIDVAAGGVNAVTVAPNNQIAVVNGTSVAAAIVAGACAMLFQWGIIDGNEPYMYAITLKTYLARGARKRSGDVYPNPQWGYGMLNIVYMFQSIT
jgi:subtilisin family serine protease